MAIDTFLQVLHACMEYRNIAIEKGATTEDFAEVFDQYFDKEEFGDTVDMALRNLNFLYLNIIEESSYQPKEKKATQKEELPKVIIGSTAPNDIDYSLTPQQHVPQQYRRFFIDNFIKGDKSFPEDISKERISNMDYADFLKTPYWKSIALYIKERDGKKCSICGATKTLEAHHLSYDNHGDELHHLEDLTCICRKCHGNLHSK